MGGIEALSPPPFPERPTSSMSKASRRRKDVMSPQSALARGVLFLRSIGHTVEYGDTAGGFVQGVRIEEGKLIIDSSTRVSTLLHEAGHIACILGQYRPMLGTGTAGSDIDQQVQRFATDVLDQASSPDDPRVRALIQCSDPEATAWAWAAGLAAGIPPELIILDNEYDGEGRDIRMMLSMRCYFGINGLAHAGMTTRSRSEAACFPKMKRWMQID